MGADGGVCYLVVENWAALDEILRLAGWLIEEVRHESALSEHIRYREPEWMFPVKGYPEAEVIEGAYGTDCGDSLQDLAEMCGRGVWPGSPFRGEDNPIAGYTFRDLIGGRMFHRRSGISVWDIGSPGGWDMCISC